MLRRTPRAADAFWRKCAGILGESANSGIVSTLDLRSPAGGIARKRAECLFGLVARCVFGQEGIWRRFLLPVKGSTFADLPRGRGARLRPRGHWLQASIGSP